MKSLPVRSEDIDPTRIVDTSRYDLFSLVGEGSWGIVWKAWDKRQHQDVAIKIISPTDEAAAQMALRNLTYAKAVQKETGKLAACSHVVPRREETSPEGVPYLVMPFYSSNFAQHIETERKQNEKVTYYDKTKTGLLLKDIIDWFSDIAAGISEIHSEYHRAHGDIKEDNILVDNKGKLLLGDLGTSTCATVGRSVSPRHHMGHVLTRDPRMFADGAHPDFKSDYFAFASLMYKMFSGKHLLEEEIGAAGPRGIDGLMHSFTDEEGDLNSKFHSLLEERVGKSEMPDEFKDLIMMMYGSKSTETLELSLFEKFDLDKCYRRAVSAYQDRMSRTAGKRELISKMKRWGRNIALATFIGASIIAGCQWMNYLSPPDTFGREEIEYRLTKRMAADADIILETEKVYEPYMKAEFVGPVPFKDLLDYHLKKMVPHSVVDEMIKVWLETCNETGIDALPRNMRQREMAMPPQLMGVPETEYKAEYQTLSDRLKDMLPVFLGACQKDPFSKVIDLEDAIVLCLEGPQKLRYLKSSSESTDFGAYKDARDSHGNQMLYFTYAPFIQQFIYNIQQNEMLGKLVRVKGAEG